LRYLEEDAIYRALRIIAHLQAGRQLAAGLDCIAPPQLPALLTAGAAAEGFTRYPHPGTRIGARVHRARFS